MAYAFVSRGGARLYSKLLVNMLQVLLHRAGTDAQDRPNIFVGLSLGHPSQDLGLSARNAKGLKQVWLHQASLPEQQNRRYCGER